MYLVRFSKQADKDKKMLKGAGFLMTAYGITSSKKVTNSFKGRGKLVY